MNISPVALGTSAVIWVSSVTFPPVLGLVLDLVVLTSDSANGASLHPSWTIR